MTTFLCELLFTCLLTAPGARAIDELSYGTALYAYYQEDYDQALVEVMVAERQQRLGDDRVRFDLAKGSFAFQEGLYRLARETFDAVDPAELTELDRMRLAFHMAREYYRRGQWQEMEAQLADIDLGANWRGRVRRHPEATFMEAEGALARGDFGAARGAIESLPDDSVYRSYALFNLGVAQRQAGDAAGSHAAFAELAQMPADDEETWDLVQRGRLALAVMARQAGDPVDAQALLGTLPGAGRYRDQALASYGNLAMARGDDELAARVWLTLLEQDGWSSGRASAYLGLPVSLERLQSPAHALERYRTAERVFSNRLAVLETASSRAREPGWVDGLLDIFADPDETTRARRLSAFDDSLGEETWLRWLAAEDVHQIMVEWRDLNGMAAWLDQLPARIGAFEQVTAERARRTAAAGKMLNDEALLGRRAALAEQVAGVEADLARLRAEPARPERDWLMPLASPEERDLIGELTAMGDLIGHMPERDQARYRARVDRLLGLVFWDVADSRGARLRALDKRLQEGRALLADVDQRIDRLAEAGDDFAAGAGTDFLLLRDRADDVSLRVAAALGARREIIARALERGLERETAETRQYLLTARIAIARATDQLAASDAGGAVSGSGS